MSKILRCKRCGDIIQSKYTHDMVWCKCGAIAIDGGDDYCKVSGNLEDMEFLVEQNNIEILETALKLACEELDKIVVFDAEFLESDSFYEYYLKKAKEIKDSEIK